MECGWDLLVKQIDTAQTLEDVIQVFSKNTNQYDDRMNELMN